MTIIEAATLLLLTFTAFMVLKSIYNKIKAKEQAKEERLRLEEEAKAKAEKERLRLEAQKLENEKLAKVKHFLSIIDDITLFNIEYDKLFSYESYLNEKKMLKWRKTAKPLYDKMCMYGFENINLKYQIVQELNTFKKNFNSDKRDDYNREFVEKEKVAMSNFFSTIEQHGLDKQQQEAVIIDEDHNLIIAGAGSGKTTTIIGKVQYLIHRYNVSPEDILLIAFTNEAVDNMKKRIPIDGIAIKTFNKFGKDVIHSATQKKPSVFSETDKKIADIFANKINTDEEFLSWVSEFFLGFMIFPNKDIGEFQTQKEYYEYLKDKELLTLQGEKVKSMEELKIANFLFKNSIPYTYERPYEITTEKFDYAQYRPDFYLTEQNIYIEHFGIINESYDVPQFFINKDDGETYDDAKKRYINGIKWKRETHKKHNTKLIETYSYQMRTVLFQTLEHDLKAAGITFKPLSEAEIWSKFNATIGGRTQAKNYIKLIVSVLNLMKSNRLTLNDIINKNSQLPESEEKTRNTLFLKIFKVILDEYQLFLQNNHFVDFSDMISTATDYVEQGLFLKKYKYILIDEFQDSSLGRYGLIKALLKQNPSTKLFCVGDDWQSIYRFAGSDISIFTDFARFFGTTAENKIETTFRFGSNLIQVSSSFIQRNDNQKKKELKAFINRQGKAVDFFEQIVDDKPTQNLKKILDKLVVEDKNIENKIIFILGRYNFNCDPIRQDPSFTIQNAQIIIGGKTEIEERIIYNKNKNLNIKFLSVHKAKGLQADYVIITHCNGGKYGFPTALSDDPILHLLLSYSDVYENGEERRLFYVALTRAKEKVFILSDPRFQSKFVTELKGNKDLNIICPRCECGVLKKVSERLKMDGTTWILKGCSNFVHGCTYTEFVD